MNKNNSRIYSKTQHCIKSKRVFKKKEFSFITCVFVSLCSYVYVSADVPSGPQILELQAVSFATWELRTELSWVHC